MSTVLLTSGMAGLAAALVAPSVELAPGIYMPTVCLGTGEYRGADAIAAVSSAIGLGYRCIDTAHEYQNQAAIGTAVLAAVANETYNISLTDIFVISKVEGGLSPEDTQARLAADTEELGLGVIDALLLHYPKALPPHTLEWTIQAQWAAISSFVDAGHARVGGVSQFCSEALSMLDAGTSQLRPVLNQVGYHVGMGLDPQGVISTAKHRGDMTLMAYSPLAEADPQLLNGTVVVAIANQVKATPAQIALRWLVQKGVPYAVAASNPVYQRENLEVFGFEIPPASMTALDMLTKPAGCPFWPGSSCYELTCNRSAAAPHGPANASSIAVGTQLMRQS